MRLGAADGPVPLDHLDPGLAELVQRERQLKLRPDPGCGLVEARPGQDAPHNRVDEPGLAPAYHRAVRT